MAGRYNQLWKKLRIRKCIVLRVQRSDDFIKTVNARVMTNEMSTLNEITLNNVKVNVTAFN